MIEVQTYPENILLAVGDPYDDEAGVDRGAIRLLTVEKDTNNLVEAPYKIIYDNTHFAGDLNDRAYFGASIANIGDLDGNGATDLLVGAPFHREGNEVKGALWIIYLDTDASVLSTKKLLLPDDDILFAGSAIANIGDIDSNGKPDLAVSAQQRGASFTDGFLPRVVIVTLHTDDTILHAAIKGEGVDGIAGLEAGQWFGKSLALIGSGQLAVGLP